MLVYGIFMDTQPTTRKKKAPRKISERYLKNAGEYYLQRFPASIGQFRVAMTRKIDRSCRYHDEMDKRDDYLKILNEETIPFFEEFGFLNDALYAKALASSLRRSGKSHSQIALRLKQKYIAPDLAKAALVAMDEDSSFPESHNHLDSEKLEHKELVAALISARKKRVGPYSKMDLSMHDDVAFNEELYKEKQKQMAKLARLGFSFDIISKVMSCSYEEAENIILDG
jgi:regulatory protein